MRLRRGDVCSAPTEVGLGEVFAGGRAPSIDAADAEAAEAARLACGAAKVAAGGGAIADAGKDVPSGLSEDSPAVPEVAEFADIEMLEELADRCAEPKVAGERCPAGGSISTDDGC